MPEVHVPKLEEHEDDEPAAIAPLAASERPRKRSLLKIVLEVALIATGVFLGLAGEQWRENRHHRELAHDALRRFRTELSTNREAVARVKDYHAMMFKRIQAYFAAEPKAREALSPNLQGIQPAFFEHTAWDLALTTQSLAYIDSDLAFSIARIYNGQQGNSELTRGVLQAMYLKTPQDNLEAFLRVVELYYADIVLGEPQLLKAYDELLPRIDRALGESPAARSESH
jgi:hypothetical protein